MSRADDMYRVLSMYPGQFISRDEMFRAAGRFWLTNNSASEVRDKYGVEVEHKVIEGKHCYRVVLGARGGHVPASPPEMVAPRAEDNGQLIIT